MKLIPISLFLLLLLAWHATSKSVGTTHCRTRVGRLEPKPLWVAVRGGGDDGVHVKSEVVRAPVPVHAIPKSSSSKTKIAKKGPSMAWPILSAHLYFLAMAFVIPVLPKIIAELVGDKGKVTSASVTMYGLLTSVDYAFTFLSCNLWATLSDRFGRKFFMALAACGLGCGFLITATAKATWTLILAFAIDGLTSCMNGIGTASVGDCVYQNPEKKSLGAAFGVYQGIAQGAAFMIGLPIGGILSAKKGYRVPLRIAIGLCALNALIITFLMPETLPPSMRSSKVKWGKATPVGAASLITRNWFMTGVVFSFFLVWAAHCGLQINWINYSEKKFAWTASQAGASMAWMGLMAGIAPKLIIPRIGNKNAMQYGLLVYALSQVLLGLAPADGVTGMVVAYAGLALTGFGAISFPAAVAILSQQVAADEKGAAQGALDTVRTLTAMVASPLLAACFGFFISDKAPVKAMGGSYLVGGAIAFVAFLFSTATFNKFEHLRKVDATDKSSADYNWALD